MREIDNTESRLVVTPGNEGADSHAVGTNLSLMSRLVFDWLDEVLDDPGGSGAGEGTRDGSGVERLAAARACGGPETGPLLHTGYSAFSASS